MIFSAGYTKEDLKKIEKKSKQEIFKLFVELNDECMNAIKAYNDMCNRTFYVESENYNRGYSEGMKRMLETVEKIFAKKGEE